MSKDATKEIADSGDKRVTTRTPDRLRHTNCMRHAARKTARARRLDRAEEEIGEMKVRTIAA